MKTLPILFTLELSITLTKYLHFVLTDMHVWEPRLLIFNREVIGEQANYILNKVISKLFSTEWNKLINMSDLFNCFPISTK